jgi:hypothetical protein
MPLLEALMLCRTAARGEVLAPAAKWLGLHHRFMASSCDKNKTAHPTKERPNGKNSCLQAKARLDQGTDRRKIGNG